MAAERVVADARFVAEHLKENDKLLDVGAVPPLMIALLSRMGFDNLGYTDPLPNSFVGFTESRSVAYHQVDLLNVSTDSTMKEQFDFVCLNEVMEHLAGNLVTAVESVVACLRPGGLLLVTTPNLRSLSGFAALALCHSGLASKPRETVRQQYDRASIEWGYFGHLREFTSKETIDFIESFGLVHTATQMQHGHMKLGRLFRCIGTLERLTPSLRLFGKYLFRKQ